MSGRGRPGYRAPMGLYPEIEPYDHGMLDVGDDNRVYCETCGNPQV
jgi:proline iminopeptidase